MKEDLKAFAVARENAKYGGLFYSVLVFFVIAITLLFSVLSSVVGGKEVTTAVWHKYVSYSLSGLVGILVSVLFCKILGKNFKDESGLSFCEKKYYIFAILLFLGMTFGLSGLNGYFTQFLVDNFGYKYNEIDLPKGNIGFFALTVLTVCILPAVAEEISFRGICVNSLRGAGKWGIAILNGFIFAVFHMSPAQTPYQFAVGFSFALLAISSRSVFPTVLIHFLNNLLIVTVDYFGGSLDFGQVGNIVATVVGLASFAAFIVLTAREKVEVKGNFVAKWMISRRFILFALVGICASLAIWIANLVA